MFQGKKSWNPYCQDNRKECRESGPGGQKTLEDRKRRIQPPKRYIFRPSERLWMAANKGTHVLSDVLPFKQAVACACFWFKFVII